MDANKEVQEQVILGNKEHIQFITKCQMLMAMETENLELTQQLVFDAVTYLISSSSNPSNHLGFYLVKQLNSSPIASLMVTIQDPNHWWIQSVYVIKEFRKAGHFKSLFNQVKARAQLAGVRNIKLYAQKHNQEAKNVYFRLGMTINEQQFFSFDFVYSKSALPVLKKANFTIQNYCHQSSNKEQSYLIQSLLTNNKNLLDGQHISYFVGNLSTIYLGENLIGVVKIFQQFSEWRFGILLYVKFICLDQSNEFFKENQSEKLRMILQEIMVHIYNESVLKVGAIRFVFKKGGVDLSQILPEGKEDDYDILEISL